MKPVQRGHLQLGPELGRSVTIPPGMGYDAHTISITNTEGGYPNTCENIRAELTFTFLHTGRKHRISGQFVAPNERSITSEPVVAVSLTMLESSQIVLLVRDTLNQSFTTFSRWPFDPHSETLLECGDWRVEIAVTSDSGQDRAEVVFHLRLMPDLSSAWTPVQDDAAIKSDITGKETVFAALLGTLHDLEITLQNVLTSVGIFVVPFAALVLGASMSLALAIGVCCLIWFLVSKAFNRAQSKAALFSVGIACTLLTIAIGYWLRPPVQPTESAKPPSSTPHVPAIKTGENSRPIAGSPTPRN